MSGAPTVIPPALCRAAVHRKIARSTLARWIPRTLLETKLPSKVLRRHYLRPHRSPTNRCPNESRDIVRLGEECFFASGIRTIRESEVQNRFRAREKSRREGESRVRTSAISFSVNRSWIHDGTR